MRYCQLASSMLNFNWFINLFREFGFLLLWNLLTLTCSNHFICVDLFSWCCCCFFFLLSFKIFNTLPSQASQSNSRTQWILNFNILTKLTFTYSLISYSPRCHQPWLILSLIIRTIINEHFLIIPRCFFCTIWVSSLTTYFIMNYLIIKSLVCYSSLFVCWPNLFIFRYFHQFIGFCDALARCLSSHDFISTMRNSWIFSALNCSNYDWLWDWLLKYQFFFVRSWIEFHFLWNRGLFLLGTFLIILTRSIFLCNYIILHVYHHCWRFFLICLQIDTIPFYYLFIFNFFYMKLICQLLLHCLDLFQCPLGFLSYCNLLLSFIFNFLGQGLDLLGIFFGFCISGIFTNLNGIIGVSVTSVISASS